VPKVDQEPFQCQACVAISSVKVEMVDSLQ
jgi:hypothetical protein